MRIENNLGKCATRATAATLLGRLRQRRNLKSDDIKGSYAGSALTEPEVSEEFPRHSVAPLTDAHPGEQEHRPDQPAADTNTPPVPFKAADLAGNEPCPYAEAALAAFRESHSHLVCCPATSPLPWNWRYREVCTTKCTTPCGRSEI